MGITSSVPTYSVSFTNETRQQNNYNGVISETWYQYAPYLTSRYLDIDGNGIVDKFTDVSLSPYYGYHNSVYMNGSSTKVVLPPTGTNANPIPFLMFAKTVDIDSDGEVDFVTSGFDSAINKRIYWKQNIRNNVLTSRVEVFKADGEYKFEDINGDGIIDWYTVGSAVVSYNLENNILVKKQTLAIVGKKMTFEANFIDINGDNLKDIITNDSVYIRRDSFYEYTALFASAEFSDQIKQNENKPQYMSTVVPGDMNTDGLIDLILYEKWWIEEPINGSNIYTTGTSFINTGKSLVKMGACPTVGMNKCFDADKVVLIKNIVTTQYGANIASVEYSPQVVKKTNTFGYPSQIFAVSKITNPATTTEYTYKNALEYFNPAEPTKKVTFFESVTAKDAIGRTKTTYFHQGNGGEVGDTLYTAGRPYKEEVHKASINGETPGELLSETFMKYGEFDMGLGRRFIYNLSTLSKIYGSSPKTSAMAYTYDTAVGEVVRAHDFGDVDSTLGSDTFADAGSDKITTSMKYSLRYGLVRVSEVKKESALGVISHQKYSYNEAGDTTKVETADQVGSFISSQFEFDTTGNMTAAVDPLGNRQTYTYNQNGTLVSSTNASGHTTVYVFDEFIGEPTKISTPDGVVMEYTYSPEGYLKDTLKNGTIIKTNTISYNTGYIQVTGIQYVDTRRTSSDNFSYPMWEADSRITTESKYNYAGQLTYERNYSVGATDYTYDAVGRLIKKSFAPANTLSANSGPLVTGYVYDIFDRTITAVDAKGVTNYVYSFAVDTEKVNTITATRGADTSTKKYNSRGLLVSNTDALGGVTLYRYNQNGNVVQITDAEGNIKTQDFDMMGKKLYTSDIHNPSDTTFGSYHFIYDKNGRLISELRPGSITISYQYDNLGRLLKKIGNDKTVNYTYDACKTGYLCSVSTNGTSTDYTYNTMGNVIKENQSIYDKTLEIRYAYNNYGTLTKTTYPQDTVEYFYDSQGFIAQMYVNGQKIVNQYNYDWNNRIQYEGGKLKQINLANGLVYVNTYNNASVGERTARTLSKGTTKLLDTMYTYNSNMLMTGMVENGATVKRTMSYVYDPLQRLTTETVGTGGVIPASIIPYSYSATGNMMSKADTQMLFGTGFESEIIRPAAADVIPEVIPEGEVKIEEAAQLPPPEILPPVIEKTPPVDEVETKIIVPEQENTTSFLYNIFKTQTAYAEELISIQERNITPITLGVPVVIPAPATVPVVIPVEKVLPPTVATTCPEGQVLVGEVCSIVVTPVVTSCIEGTILNENGQCVAPTAPPQTPTCAANERLIRNTCVKVQLLPLGCPVGQSQVGSACIPQVITCPVGLTVGLDGYCHDSTDKLYCSSYMTENCIATILPPPPEPVGFNIASIYNSLSDLLSATDEFKDTLIYSIIRKNKTDITFQKDQAGIAVVKNGDTSVTITFTEPFTTPPLMTLGATSLNTPYIQNLSITGMRIILEDRASGDTAIHWYAKGLTDKQIKRDASDGSTIPPEVVIPPVCPPRFQKVGEVCVPIPDNESEFFADYYTPQTVTKTTEGTSKTIYSYDKQGNLIHSFKTNGTITKDTTYSWNSLGELTQTSEPTQSHNYLYNQNGIRVYKEDVTGEAGAPIITKTYYFGGYTQYNATEYTIDIPIVDSVSVTLLNKNGVKSLSYSFSNHLGTTELTTDSTGTITDSYISTAYGTTQLTTGTHQKKFALHRIDSDSLIYMNARYYSPYTASFISKDPTSLLNIEQTQSNPLSANAYAYANGNPISNNDPDGKWFKEVITGKQSWNDFTIEVGEATQYLTDHSKVWNYMVNNPVKSGVAIGIVSGAAAVGGATVVGNVSVKYFGAAGLACVANCSQAVNYANDMAGQITTRGVAVAENAVPVVRNTFNSVHAVLRQSQRSISMSTIQDILSKPKVVLQQGQSVYLYLSNKGGVAINTTTGRIITNYASNNFYQEVKDIINIAYQNNSLKTIARSAAQIVTKLRK